MRKTFTLLVFTVLIGIKGWGQVSTFSYTGANQTYTVPANVTSITVKLWGAGGGGSGGSNAGGSGGSGAFFLGTLTVTPGQTITVVVGGGGAYSGTAASAATFGGGGASGGPFGCSGGGFSGIFNTTTVSQTNALAIAGGGAGGGYANTSTYGGAGGATTGSSGGNNSTSTAYTGGVGATISSGGSGGFNAANATYNGSTGSGLAGGTGAAGGATNKYGGGGGGGGYYGGGGGYGTANATYYSGGGGGGSSFVGSITNYTNSPGVADISGTGSATQAPGNGQTGYVTGIGNGGANTGTSGGNGLVIITPVCPTPTVPGAISVTLPTTTTSISGTITPPGTAPAGYIVILSTNSTLTSSPITGTTYTAGTLLGGGTVQYAGTSTSYTASTSLSSNTKYYLFAYSYNSGSCGTAYSLTSATNNGTTLPAAPTIGTATAGNAQASVAFTASAGTAVITGYTATSNPGGFTGTGTSSAITVTGLTNGTSYTFTVTATNAGGTGVASVASNSVTPTTPCSTPSVPTGLSLVANTATTITGTFAAPSPAPSNYLVIRTNSSSAPTVPSNGTTYTAGATALGGYIVSINTTTGFTDNTVAAATQYWYWVYSYNNISCSGGPTYSATNVSGTITTAAQKNWVGYGTSGGTSAQTDFNAAANWSSGTSPTAGDNLIMTITTAVSPTIIMSANNITVNSLTITTSQTGNASNARSFSLSTNGNNFTITNAFSFTSTALGAGAHTATFLISGGTTNIGSATVSSSTQASAGTVYTQNITVASGATLIDNGNLVVSQSANTGGSAGSNYLIFLSNSGTFTVNGTTVANSTSGTGGQVQLGVANGANTTFAGTATFDDGSSSSTDSIFLKSTTGITTGKFVFKNNVNFGVEAATSSSNIPGTYVFDGTGSQIITNNSVSLTTLSSIQIGNTNSPSVSFAGSTTALTLNSSNVAGVVSNLVINNNAVLDLGIYLLNRGTGTNTSGGFAINNTGTLKLGNTTGGQTGSNFPLGFSFSDLVTGSTVEYYAAGSQTVYTVASPGYGNVTIGDITTTPATTGTATTALIVAGNLLINSSAKFAAGTSLTHNIGGNWTNNGTFSYTTGSTVNFNTAGSTLISGSGATAFQNIIVNKGSDGTNILEANGVGALSNTGAITITNGLFKMTTGTWTYGTGTIPVTGGLQVNGAALSTGSFTNNGLIRITSGNATFGAALGDVLTNSVNGLFDFQGGAVNFTGRLNNSASATGTPPAWYTPNGVSISGNGILTVATLGNASGTIGSFNMTGVSNVTMTGGTVVVQNPNTNATPFNDINIVSTTGTKSLTAGTFQIGNTSTAAGKTFLISSAVAIGKLTVNNTSSPTARLVADLTVNNNISINGGTLDAATNNKNITLGGNWTNAGTFSPGTGTVTFNGTTGTQTVNNNSSTFTILSHSGASTLQVLTNPITGTGTFTNSAGIFDPATNGLATNIAGLTTVSGGNYLAGSGTQTLTGGLTVSGGIFTGATGAVNTSAVILSNGTLTAPSGLFSLTGAWTVSGGTFGPGTNTVTFAGSTNQNLNSGGQSFYNIDHPGTGNLTLVTNNLIIGGTFTNELPAGNFKPVALSTSIAGLTTIYGGIFIATGIGTQNLIGGLLLPNVNGSYGSSTSTGVTNIGGTLTVTDGAFGGSLGTVNAVNVVLDSGTFQAPSGLLNVSGNFTNLGIFNESTGTVTLNGTSVQTLTGGTTFYNLTVNNSAGAAFSDADTVSNVFNVSNGIITIASGKNLAVTNIAPAAITGGSSTAYVDGPLAWSLPGTAPDSVTTYVYPLGNLGEYLPFSISRPTTSGANPTYQVQAFATTAGGTGDGGSLAVSGSLSTTEYWYARRTTSVSGSISLTRPTPVSPYNTIAYNNTKAGVYSAYGGTPSGNSINNSVTIAGSFNQYYVMGETPTINISTALSPSSVATCIGTASSNMTLSLTGAVMINGITVTPPAGFEVSLSPGSGFTSSVVIGNGGTIAATNVYIRLKSTDTTGTYSGNIVLTSTGATTVNAPISASTVNPLTVISSQPSGSTYCQNIIATALSVTTTGAALTYQWYSNASNNNTMGTSTAGATSSTYTPSTVTAGTTYYYVIVAGTCGTITSTTAGIIVNAATVISVNPTGATYCQSATATSLSVTATGTGALAYQWYSNATNNNTTGTLISGATSSAYIPSTITAGTTYYYVVVNSTCGTATSTIATILVNATTVISTNPTGATYCQNAAAAALSVTATTGTSLTYQWYSNASNSNTGGIAIGSATSSTYLPSTITVSTKYYYVTVTGTCGTSTSSTAAVIVNASTVITANPTTTQTVCQNATPTTLSVTATGTGTLTYQWYINPSNSNTGGTTIDSATSSSYVPSTSTAGTVYYYVMVTGTCGTATSATAAVIVNASTVITANPTTTQTVCQNATPTTLSVTATGTGTLTYQWYSNPSNSNTGGTTIGSATSSSYVPSTATAGTVYYYVIVSGTCGKATSTIATLVVNATTVITANPTGATYCQNATATVLGVTATGTSLIYQWYSNTTNTNTGGTSLGSTNGGQTASYTPSTVTAGTTYYYVIVAGTCGTVTSNTATVIINATTVISGQPIGATYCQNATVTALSITATGTSLTYQWYSNTTNSNTGATSLGSTSGGQTALYTPSTVTSGTTYYYVVVSSTCGTVISNTATVLVNATTVISGQPTGAIYCQNATATALSVTSTGTSLTYQWYSNTTNSNTGGTSLGSTNGGQTVSYTPSTIISGTTYYYMIVSGICGTATSNTSTVAVTVPPSAAIAYSGSPYCSGGGTATVTMSGTTGGTYSSTTGLVIDGTSGAVTLGTSTPGTYTVTYTVAASGGCSVYTTTASITITSTPSATISYNGGASFCPNTGTGAVTQTGTTGGSYSASPAGLVIDPSTGAININTSLAGSYTVTYTVAASGGCSVYTTSTTVSIGADVWTGTNNTNWNNVNNWSCYVVPNINTDVIVPSGVIHYPTISTSPVATARNIQIANGASLTISGQKLQVSGTIADTTGIFDVSAGTIEFNGTASAQTIPVNVFNGNIINNLVISNNVSMAGANSLIGVVSFGSASKTFTTNDNLTLKSLSSGTAAIDVVNNGNAITGNVTIERYIATGTGPDPNDHPKTWQLLAVPTTGQTLKQSWMENAASNITPAGNNVAGQPGNPNPGYGTMVTSDDLNAIADGFDTYTRPGPTVKAYDYLHNTYVGLPNAFTQLYDQRGYFVFARGDRSVYAYNQTADHTILRTKGQLFEPGSTNMSTPPASTVPAGYFQSIGNPYASPIDMSKVSATGGSVNQFFYVWDPRVGGAYNYGAFVTFYYDNTTDPANPTYRVGTNGGATYPASGTAYNYIQSGQAFFMQATGVDGTVSFPESAKAASQSFIKPFTREGNGGVVSTAGGRTAGQTVTEAMLHTTLNTVNTDGSTGSMLDGVLDQFGDNYADSVDGFDARKAANTGENLSIRTGGKLLVIERKHTIVASDTIFLNLTGERAQPYQFSIDAQDLNTTVAAGVMVDKYTNTFTPLNLKGNTVVNFTVVNVAGSYAPDRFMIVFSPLRVLPVTFASIKAYKQDKNINVEWSVENERNIKEYGVEKSVNGTDFTTLNITKPSNNNGGSAGYVSVDAKPATGYNYYRIRSVDLNGSISYSTIVKVMIRTEKSDINIYPNPITDGQIHLQLQNEPQGKYGIRLLNKLGQVIMSKEITREDGSSTELIRWDFNLAHGMYQLEVTKPDGTVKNINVMY